MTPLAIAAVLGVGALGGIWLYSGRHHIPLLSRAARALATPEYLGQRAEEELERGGSGAQQRSTELLRQALSGDPASPYRWCALGEAEADAGDQAAARQCFRRAVELGPNIPPVLMRAANYLFAEGDRREAMRHTRRVLELARAYDSAIFSTYERMGVSADEAIREGLPDVREARIGFFKYLVGRGARSEAAVAWKWLAGLRACDAALAAEYTSYLLRERAYREAAETWTAHLGRRSPDYGPRNRVFNGGFESELIERGLDWTVAPQEGVAVERSREARSGHWSLQLEFEGGRNLDYRHVFEQVIVEPGRYWFQAWIRTEAITTNEGLRFRIADAQNPSRLDVVTEAAAGTRGWTEMTAAVTVAPATHLLQVTVTRRPSLKFDSKIKGKAWVDDVELAPAGEGGKRIP